MPATPHKAHQSPPTNPDIAASTSTPISPWPPQTPIPPTPSTLLRYTPYARPRDATTERGVLSFPPYTPALLPHWRFATISAARVSSQTLLRFFNYYEEVDDWIGADMTRKFLQMGVTRARRYANYKGGRKYKRDERGVRTGGVEVKRVRPGRDEESVAGLSEGERKKMEEKVGASEVFREALEEVRGREWYQGGRERFWGEVRSLEGKGWRLGEDGQGVRSVGDENANEAMNENKTYAPDAPDDLGDNVGKRKRSSTRKTRSSIEGADSRVVKPGKRKKAN